MVGFLSIDFNDVFFIIFLNFLYNFPTDILEQSIPNSGLVDWNVKSTRLLKGKIGVVSPMFKSAAPD